VDVVVGQVAVFDRFNPNKRGFLVVPDELVEALIARGLPFALTTGMGKRA
jgi:hypothetical protein